MSILSRPAPGKPTKAMNAGATRIAILTSLVSFFLKEWKVGQPVTAASGGEYLREQGVIQTPSNKGVGDAIGKEGFGLWRYAGQPYPACQENAANVIDWAEKHGFDEKKIAEVAVVIGFESTADLARWIDNLPKVFTA